MRRTLLAVVPLLLLSACGGANQASVLDAQTGSSEAAAAASSQARDGAPLAIQGFSATGEYVLVDGESVMMFGYPTEQNAMAEQARIAPDGQMIGDQPLSWAGPVHFFRRGRFIAVYVGSQRSVLEKLGAEGGQFAGN